MQKRTPRPVRRLVLPVVLAVTTAGLVAAASTAASGCGDGGPAPTDASLSDGGYDARPDGPIV